MENFFTNICEKTFHTSDIELHNGAQRIANVSFGMLKLNSTQTQPVAYFQWKWTNSFQLQLDPIVWRFVLCVAFRSLYPLSNPDLPLGGEYILVHFAAQLSILKSSSLTYNTSRFRSRPPVHLPSLTFQADCGSVKGAGVPAEEDTEHHYLPLWRI